MLYRPKKGQIKDGCMVYANETFYLFSMYHKENSDGFNHVWLATSRDGVHFEDYGCVVEDFPACIWAMKVYRAGDTYYMNSGSFTPDGEQAILKFWQSADLLHWEYRSDLDVLAPNHSDPKARLDCMNVVEKNGHFYGYATGQYSYLESEDGAHWTAHPARIDYHPFPPYNTALGGFEIADFIEMEGRYYLLCGGFGHLGMSGYGVYLYGSETPDGTFTPCLPYYRLNGTSKRWINMWERCFLKDGDTLAHNYVYDGYTYECGNVFLPPIKRLIQEGEKLCLTWWDGNSSLYGKIVKTTESLRAERPRHDVREEEDQCVEVSDLLSLPPSAILHARLTLSENKFTKYSSGGIYLAEDASSGSAILFDTYGACHIAHVKAGKIEAIEDTIGFGSTAPYHLQDGKTYDIRILCKNGFFEIYVNDRYLQTFNTAHTPTEQAKPIIGMGTIAKRSGCTLSDITIYEMKN